MDTSEPGFAEALSAAAGRAERMLERGTPPSFTLYSKSLNHSQDG